MTKELLERATEQVLLSKGWNEMAEYKVARDLAAAILRAAIEACAEVAARENNGQETDWQLCATCIERDIRALLD